MHDDNQFAMERWLPAYVTKLELFRQRK